MRAMSDSLITLPTVCERVALSGSEIYRRIREGVFPAPVPIGKTRVAWSVNEIDAYVERCKHNREMGQKERRESALRANAASQQVPHKPRQRKATTKATARG